VPVSMMDQVLQHALVRMPEPIEWDEASVLKGTKPPVEDDSTGVVAH
jgi:ATP-dependent Lon protease